MKGLIKKVISQEQQYTGRNQEWERMVWLVPVQGGAQGS